MNKDNSREAVAGYLTSREAAKILHVSRSQINRLAEAMNCTKLPGRNGPYLLTESDLRLIAARMNRSFILEAREPGKAGA